jgi:hypothetical protein
MVLATAVLVPLGQLGRAIEWIASMYEVDATRLKQGNVYLLPSVAPLPVGYQQIYKYLYMPELSQVPLSIHYRMREDGNVLEDETTSLVFTQYADAITNPPLSSRRTIDVAIYDDRPSRSYYKSAKTLGVRLRIAGFDIIYNTFTNYMLIPDFKIVYTIRMISWVTTRVKPVPFSIIV